MPSHNAALELSADPGLDASAEFVLADAPVTDPYARYAVAVEAGNAEFVERFRLYWPDEATTREGNPNLILKRGERVELPPLLISQGTADRNVPLAMTREFVERYQSAGGEVQLVTFEGVGHGFILQEPGRPESGQQAEAYLAFIRAHAGVTAVASW